MTTAMNIRSRAPQLMLLLTLAAVAVLLLLPATSEAKSKDHLSTYEVTLRNLTSTQIFSPPLFVTGNGEYKLFRAHRYASDELRMLAEGGDNGPAASQAASSRKVRDVVALGTPLPPGESVTVTIEARRGDRLSLAAMLVNTNDGFAGADRLRLPRHGRMSTLYLKTYDAGTEINNELAAYIPGPPFGGMLRAPDHKRISVHPGILGVGDLSPAMYDWDDPSAMVTIKMVAN
jgi:hypothetical protein